MEGLANWFKVKVFDGKLVLRRKVKVTLLMVVFLGYIMLKLGIVHSKWLL